MKRKLISAALCFAALLIAVTAYFMISERSTPQADKNAENVVALNEIDRLYIAGETEKAAEKSDILKDELRGDDETSGNMPLIVCGICILFVGAVFAYIYFAILRPFEKLQGFADNIAKGRFDIPLEYERQNYFGKFTWAFDSMRREIIKARSCEQEAIENNKTVIATLSHDIKTPIASLRAYAEGLEANLDSSHEKRSRYISVIMRKCDEVASLTDDLFLHSLSDLDKLKVTAESFELCGFVKQTVSELAADKNDIIFTDPGFTAEVTADKKRMAQLIGNLINNSRKYAKTEITVSLAKEEGTAVLTVSDRGKGIPDEDIPFIFDKFYRGHNCGSEQGSGLGLYIVKYIAEKQGGTVSLRNRPEGGLEVEIRLPCGSASA